MDPNAKKLIRLLVAIAAFAAVFYLLRTLNAVPAVLETYDPGKLSTPAGTARAGGLEILIAIVVAGLVVWKYQSSIFELISGGQETAESHTARSQIAALQKSGLSDQERAYFERLAIQAIYEKDKSSLKFCVGKLTGVQFLERPATPPPPPKAKSTSGPAQPATSQNPKAKISGFSPKSAN